MQKDWEGERSNMLWCGCVSNINEKTLYEICYNIQHYPGKVANKLLVSNSRKYNEQTIAKYSNRKI